MIITIECLLNTLLRSNISLEQAEQLGRNIWAHGLRMQGHRTRIQQEEAELSVQQKESLKKASKIRSTNKVKRIKARIRAEKLKQDREVV